jgi:hypothetical protein
MHTVVHCAPPTAEGAVLPKKFDSTLALKAIALAEDLNGSDKRVAVAILDHQNRKTGRCDPSYETLSDLLGIDRRTVGRSVKKIEKTKYFVVLTRRGINHCNSYQPNWVFYRELEVRWMANRLRRRSVRIGRQEVSSLYGQDCPGDEGEVVLQTCTSNFISLTSSNEDSSSPGKQEQRTIAAGDDPVDCRGLGIAGERLKKRLGDDVYKSWFLLVHFVEADHETVVLSASKKMFANYIIAQYQDAVLDCFRPEHNGVFSLKIIVR